MAEGVPSVARFIHLSTSTSANQAPTAAVSNPSSNVTVNPGGSISFAGSGSDPDGTVASYSWSFAGGHPGTSHTDTPGAVTYSTPGTYPASLIVTDNLGTASTPVVRTVTVADFSLQPTKNLKSVLPGSGTSYPVTVRPVDGFTGAVSFGVLGLPSGATATFAPASISGFGSTTLTVSTSSSTPPGSYILTIDARSGPVTRSANVTLVVGGFSLSILPAARTMTRGGNNTKTYVISTAPGAGFTGSVTLSINGVPRSVTATFSQNPIAASGTSTLTVHANDAAPPGTYSLIVTAMSDGQMYAVPIMLTIQ